MELISKIQPMWVFYGRHRLSRFDRQRGIFGGGTPTASPLKQWFWSHWFIYEPM